MEKALEILNQTYIDDSNTLCIPSNFSPLDVFNAIQELEEAMKHKTCDGCKHQQHTIKDIQNNGSWMKYSVFYECTNDKGCKRNTVDRYERKDTQC